MQLEISESIYCPCNRKKLIERCLADLILVGIPKEKMKPLKDKLNYFAVWIWYFIRYNVLMQD